MSEQRDWVVEKGDRGEQGVQGERGERGEKGVSRLPSRQAWAIVYMFALNMAILGVGLFWLAHIQSENNRVRCTALAQIVAIPVPVPTAGNPSREWVADYTRIERQRGAALGCPMPAPRYVTVQPGH